MSLLDDAAAIAGELADLRRRIHREPEIGLDLPRTQEKVLAALHGLPLELTRGRALSSVTAVLRGGRPVPTNLVPTNPVPTNPGPTNPGPTNPGPTSTGSTHARAAAPRT